MRRFDQVVTEDGKGDCIRACVCTLLDLEPASVPNFAECGYFEGLDEWLKERELRFYRVNLTGCQNVDAMYFGYPHDERDLMIVWGESPRVREDGTKKQHAVLMMADGYGLRLFHDPHLDRAGLKAIAGFGRIVFAARVEKR